ncbi:MAG: hypothetical protein HRT70_01400 [Flavobacteriaceae bacterium]|nr:hypothetical protein [Flavobacteriaceae bacterium]
MPWGVGMFIIMTIIFPLMNEQPITIKKVLISLPLWMLGGWLFGYAMNRWLHKDQ